MKFTIENMPPLIVLDEKGKEVKLNGYAFMDECKHCIIIVYGEGSRDAMAKYLTEEGDPLGIKYHYVNMLPSSNG